MTNGFMDRSNCYTYTDQSPSEYTVPQLGIKIMEFGNKPVKSLIEK